VYRGEDNVVSIAIRYELEGRFSKPGRVRFSRPIWIEPEVHPTLYILGKGFLFLRYSGQDVALNTAIADLTCNGTALPLFIMGSI
jgi:hypothetical protein